MSSIDTYGDLELPEETSRIEIIENPLQVINGIYSLFKAWTKKLDDHFTKKGQYWIIGDNEEKIALNKKLKALFEGKQNLKLNSEEVINLIREKTNSFDGTDIFLNVLHNCTALDILILNEFEEQYSVGEKLNQGKTLIIGHETSMGMIGNESEGNILNYGSVGHFCQSAKKGVKINFGKVIRSFGYRNKNGLYINQNISEGTFWNGVLDSIFINNGNINNAESLPINKNGIKIDNKGHRNYTDAPIIDLIKFKKHPMIKPLKRKFDEKLWELHFLERVRWLEHDEILREIRSFDFKKYEQEVNEIAEQIQEEYWKLSEK